MPCEDDSKKSKCSYEEQRRFALSCEYSTPGKVRDRWVTYILSSLTFLTSIRLGPSFFLLHHDANCLDFITVFILREETRE